MNSEERFTLEYNKRQIQKQVAHLSSICLGYNNSIIPYISNSPKRVTANGLKRFIKDIVPDRVFIRMDGMDMADEEGDGYLLSKEEKAFYESFFYCAIRCYSNDLETIYGIWEEFRPCETFQDILDRAQLIVKDRRFEEYDDLLKHEAFFATEDWYPEFYSKTGFFASMDSCIRLITGESVLQIDQKGFSPFTEQGKYWDVPEEIANNSREESTEEPIETERERQIFEENDKYLHMLEKIKEERWPAWEAYIKGFSDRDRAELLHFYREYRKLYFEVNKDVIYDAIEAMIDSFMWDRGISIYSAPDSGIVRELTGIEKAERMINSALRRTKNE